jgi:hypothetical protein
MQYKEEGGEVSTFNPLTINIREVIMTQNMHRIGNGVNFLTADDLKRLPSIGATHESAALSDRYRFISTMNVVNTLADQGWLPVAAQEQNVKSTAKIGFQKHLIRFQYKGLKDLKSVGDVAPEIVLTNSHDGYTKYNFMLGLFRLVCLNGMIVSEGSFGSIKIMHVGYEEKDVIDASFKILDDVPRLFSSVDKYRRIELTPSQRDIFAESALVLRFGDDDSLIRRDGPNFTVGDRTFNLSALLRPNRSDDEGRSLWNTFNVVQEKITQGNRYERTVRETNGKIIHKSKVQGINGIDSAVSFNRGLWHMMERMAEERGVDQKNA